MENLKSHYCVIYTQVLKQWSVTEIIRRALPEGQGEVFYPCVELWWHGANKTKFRPLFPGYVFIRSDMEIARLHDLIRKSRREILSFMKELHISEKRESGEDVPGEASVIDLDDDEAKLFDLLLGFQFDEELERRRLEAEKEGKLYIPPGIAGNEEDQDKADTEEKQGKTDVI